MKMKVIVLVTAFFPSDRRDIPFIPVYRASEIPI